MSNYETAFEIEIAIANHFGKRDHTIVPNVSWGMFPYELDLCILNNRSLYADEVEIKISKSDLKRDLKKAHNHDWNQNLIRRLWFAMPENMSNCIEYVPDRAGIILVSATGSSRIIREPKINKLAKKWTHEQAFKLARLGVLRFWNIKEAPLQMRMI